MGKLECAYLAIAIGLPLLKACGLLTLTWGWALVPVIVPAGAIALVLVAALLALTVMWLRGGLKK